MLFILGSTSLSMLKQQVISWGLSASDELYIYDGIEQNSFFTFIGTTYKFRKGGSQTTFAS